MDLVIRIASVQDPSSQQRACAVILFDATAARPVHEAGYILERLPSDLAADYHALTSALRMALPMGPAHVRVESASRALVDRITGAAETDRDDERQLHDKALMQLLALDAWSIAHVPAGEGGRLLELAQRALRSESDAVELDGEETPVRQQRRFTGVPQWTAELLEDPADRCPARCEAERPFPFGPDTPAGFCVHAASVVLLDGPLNWADPAQRQMTTLCPHCDIPIRIRLVE